MNSVRYQYVSTRNRRHPVTVAYTTSEKEGSILVTIGASFCHKTDRFVRRSGREIAENRFRAGQVFQFSIPFDRTVTSAYGKTVSDGLRNYVENNDYKISLTYSNLS